MQNRFFDQRFSKLFSLRIVSKISIICFLGRISSSTVRQELFPPTDYSMAPNSISVDLQYACAVAFATARSNLTFCCMRRCPGQENTTPLILTLISRAPNGWCGCRGVKVSGRGRRVSPLLSLFDCPHGDAEGVPGWPRGRAG
jgi:hypothetical protein